MNKRTHFLSLLFFLCTVFAVSAQATDWQMSIFRITDDDGMQSGIAEQIQNGFTPVGMSGLDGNLLAIIFQKLDYRVESFAMEYITPVDTISTRFSEYMVSGYAPIDIAFLGDGVLALFVKSELYTPKWKLQSVDGETAIERRTHINDLMASAAAERLYPFGLSRFENKLMIGFSASFLREEADLNGDFTIESYNNTDPELAERVNGRISEGYVINGIDYDNGMLYFSYFK